MQTKELRKEKRRWKEGKSWRLVTPLHRPPPSLNLNPTPQPPSQVCGILDTKLYRVLAAHLDDSFSEGFANSTPESDSKAHVMDPLPPSGISEAYVLFFTSRWNS